MKKYLFAAITFMTAMTTACSSAPKAEENTASAATTEVQQAAELMPAVVTINFAFDSAVMPKQSYPAVKLFLKNIKQENFTISVDGYTDDIGTEIYNTKLSMRRAETVANYLIDNGINSDIIITRGHGKTDFVADNDTEEGRAKNRRVEITILD